MERFVAIDPFVIFLTGLYLLMSVITFAAYGRDKAAARDGRQRTPERTLHLLALGGGWPGALVGRRVFRHKTRKQPFATIFWITLVANCAIVASLLAWS